MKKNEKKYLQELFQGISNVEFSSNANPVIDGVTEDSRDVGENTLFVAVKGRRVDGHEYVVDVLDSAIAAVVVDRDAEVPETKTPIVRVDDTRIALAVVSANLYGRPGDELTLVGVTGTNGKTTVCYLLEAMLKAAGKEPGVIGTVSYRYGGKSFQAPYTTPTAPVLHKTLREMKNAGCSHVLMEVSSHALEMKRVYGLIFTVAGFTNLTQDHLDLHGDMDRYFKAKQALFSNHLAEDGVAVLWVDDPKAEEMAAPFSGEKILCSASARDADVRLLSSSLTLEGMSVKIGTPAGEVEISSSLLGSTNLSNILVAAGMAYGLGVSPDAIKNGVKSISVIPGRLERVDDKLDRETPTVLVDYAHTPDAIRQVVKTLKPLCKGRLFIIFGCGGDRDQTKRPIMGRAAAGADVVVVTSDNPRTEDCMSIIRMAVPGVADGGCSEVEVGDLSGVKSGYVVIPDRRKAIEKAIMSAASDDVVLIAGKGHEDYQILGTERVHFDDREEGKKALESRKKGLVRSIGS